MRNADGQHDDELFETFLDGLSIEDDRESLLAALRTDPRRLQQLLFAAQSISSRIPIVRLQVPHSFKQITSAVQTVRSLL